MFIYNKILTIALIVSTLRFLFLQANEQAAVSITGRLDRFVFIRSFLAYIEINLSHYYSLKEDILEGAIYHIPQVSAYSNLNDGYKISVGTTNNFQMVNEDGTEIQYTLEFKSSEATLKNSQTHELEESRSVFIETLGKSSSDYQVEKANLQLVTLGKKDLLLDEMLFKDSIKMSIMAN